MPDWDLCSGQRRGDVRFREAPAGRTTWWGLEGHSSVSECPSASRLLPPFLALEFPGSFIKIPDIQAQIHTLSGMIFSVFNKPPSERHAVVWLPVFIKPLVFHTPGHWSLRDPG